MVEVPAFPHTPGGVDRADDRKQHRKDDDWT